MNEEERLSRLVLRARAERPPQVDVARRVMAALCAQRAPLEERADPWTWVAASSAAAAIAAIVIVLASGETWSQVLMTTLSDLPWWVL